MSVDLQLTGGQKHVILGLRMTFTRFRASKLVPRASLLIAAMSFSCTRSGCWTPDFKPTQLDRLVMKLEGSYTRNFDQDDFSLHYGSKAPNTVVVKVEYTSATDTPIMYRVIESARETIQGMGKDDFGLKN